MKKTGISLFSREGVASAVRRAARAFSRIGLVPFAAMLVLGLFVLVAGGLMGLSLAPEVHALAFEIAVLAFAAVTAVAALAVLDRRNGSSAA